MNARAYPLPRPDDNTLRRGLAYDVARCLESLGLPRFTLDDIAELRTLLLKFLYALDAVPAVTVLDAPDRPSAFRRIAGACLTCGNGFLPGEVPEDGVCGGCLLAAAIAVRVELCDHEACSQPGTVKTDDGLLCIDHLKDVLTNFDEPDRTPAEILAGLRVVFGEPVEGRDYHVMPDREAAMAPARAEEDRIAGELAVVRVELVPAPAPLAAWELELLARPDPRTPEQVAHDELVRRDELVRLQDGDQPATPARGHGQEIDECHAMTPEGAMRPRCGATGWVAMFATTVTCPQCLVLLAEQMQDDGDADEDFEFYPMTADDIPALTATSFERLFGGAHTEPDTGYSDEQLDGTACISCGQDFANGEASIPLDDLVNGHQLFRHEPSCPITTPSTTEPEEAPHEP